MNEQRFSKPNKLLLCVDLHFGLLWLEPLLTTLPCDSEKKKEKRQSWFVFKQLLFTWTLQQVCNPLILFQNVRILELHPLLRCPLRGTLQSAQLNTSHVSGDLNQLSTKQNT